MLPKLTELVLATWKKILETEMEHSFKKCYITITFDGKEQHCVENWESLQL